LERLYGFYEIVIRLTRRRTLLAIRLAAIAAGSLCAVPVWGCGGPGYSIFLNHAPTSFPEGAVLLQVIVHRPKLVNRFYRTEIRAKVVSGEDGGIDIRNVIVDFKGTRSSCEFPRATGKLQFVVGHLRRFGRSTSHLEPILYGEGWVMTKEGARFEGMEPQ
jgi:hypothetical protein